MWGSLFSLNHPLLSLVSSTKFSEISKDKELTKKKPVKYLLHRENLPTKAIVVFNL